MKNTCENCLYFVEEQGYNDCHRYPQTIFVFEGDIISSFPYTQNKNWCGEHKPKSVTKTK